MMRARIGLCDLRLQPREKQAFRVRGGEVLAKDLLHGSEELTEHLQPATSKQLMLMVH